MMSGATLFEHIVVLFSRPPALQLLPGLTKSPGGTVKPLFGVANAVWVPAAGVPIVGAPATPLPFDAKMVCRRFNRHAEPERSCPSPARTGSPADVPS